MKRLMLSLTVFLLIACMMVSCTAPLYEDPNAQGSAFVGSGTDADNNDLVSILVPGGANYTGTDLLTQPKGKEQVVNGGNLATNTKFNANAGETFPDADKIIEAGRADTPIYGIYCWIEDFERYYDSIQDIGFTNARIGNASGMSERQFRLLAESDIDYFFTVGVSANSYIKPEAQSKSNLTLDDFDLDAWYQKNVDFAINLLRKYGPNGTFFQENPDVNYNPCVALEIYNEPNYGYMVSDKKTSLDVRAQLYARVLCVLYDAIKAEFPEVQVIGGGLGGASNDDAAFLRKVFNAVPESAQKMDVLSTHHSYTIESVSAFAYKVNSTTSLGGLLKNLRSTMSGADCDVPVWYTEGGWMLNHNHGGELSESNGGCDQLTQAAMLVQQCVFGIRCGLERITFMYIIDTDGCNYGFIYRNGYVDGDDGSKWRLSAYAMETMIEILPDPVLTDVIYEGLDDKGNISGVFAYEIEPAPGAEPVVVVCTTAEPTEVSIPWEEEYAVVTDLFGTSKIIQAKKGKITLEAGTCMLYVRKVSEVPDLDKVINYTEMKNHLQLDSTYAWVPSDEDLV